MVWLVVFVYQQLCLLQIILIEVFLFRQLNGFDSKCVTSPGLHHIHQEYFKVFSKASHTVFHWYWKLQFVRRNSGIHGLYCHRILPWFRENNFDLVCVLESMPSLINNQDKQELEDYFLNSIQNYFPERKPLHFTWQLPKKTWKRSSSSLFLARSWS